MYRAFKICSNYPAVGVFTCESTIAYIMPLLSVTRPSCDKVLSQVKSSSDQPQLSALVQPVFEIMTLTITFQLHGHSDNALGVTRTATRQRLASTHQPSQAHVTQLRVLI